MSCCSHDDMPPTDSNDSEGENERKTHENNENSFPDS